MFIQRVGDFLEEFLYWVVFLWFSGPEKSRPPRQLVADSPLFWLRSLEVVWWVCCYWWSKGETCVCYTKQRKAEGKSGKKETRKAKCQLCSSKTIELIFCVRAACSFTSTTSGRSHFTVSILLIVLHNFSPQISGLKDGKSILKSRKAALKSYPALEIVNS